MAGLEKKLPAPQLALLYRKFAVFNAVQKNNTRKYKLYLGKLWRLSKGQAFITTLYVPAMKLKHLFTVGFAGVFAVLGYCFNAPKKTA